MAGAVISAGILLVNTGSKLIITDAEYLIGWSRSREITQCDQPEYKLDKTVERTPESKATCKSEASIKALAGRDYDYKYNIIWWAVRLILCLIVYGFHYPKLRKINEETDVEQIAGNR